jgi:hypothetical protein
VHALYIGPLHVLRKGEFEGPRLDLVEGLDLRRPQDGELLRVVGGPGSRAGRPPRRRGGVPSLKKAARARRGPS